MKKQGALFFVIAFFAACSLGLGHAQQNQPTPVAGYEVDRYVEMRYPPLARTARVQGTVVVEVTLDDAGKVTQADGISGGGVLVRPAVENVRSWTFKPNSTRNAVVVYNFVMLSGACADDASLFVLERDNLATIMTCPINLEADKAR